MKKLGNQDRKKTYIESVDNCLLWIENQMLSYNRGSVGVYERIRIDVNRRVCWTRPDCNSEVARVLAKRENADYKDVYVNIVDWLLSVQDNNPLSAWYGSFPFYLYNGEYSDLSGEARFQNDNGKVLIALLDMYEITADSRLKDAAVKLADYWLSIQRPEGYFFRYDKYITQGLYKGPCFVFWLAAGIAQCYGMTGEKKYLESAIKAFDYLLPLQLESGRFATTYEMLKHEDWRPPSSESSIALFCLARACRYIDDNRYKKAFLRVADYVLTLQAECGAIINSDADSLNASLQENPMICDLVYTEGFALMGFVEGYKVSGKDIFKDVAIKLGDFLVSIQCKGESPLWDGAWRGTFNTETMKWDGRANQNNNIDEGGMYSVYTGWCAATIMDGLLGVIEIM
ncbi:MAG: hypothetical protein PHY15_01335 [Eubacteriales bacterium]|nr:hypothetical protein [Eubacteriales bacterium]MDD4475060.1 hypothetical protein [Eubacteriales bacterium]